MFLRSRKVTQGESTGEPEPAKTEAAAPHGGEPSAEPVQDKITSGDNTRESEIAERIASAVGRIVILLMRSEAHRKISVADLKWLVVPPVLAGQFSFVGRRRDAGGIVVPVAAVLWARVSPEVDARLSADPSKPITLAPEAWTSGEIIWLVEAVGEAPILKQMIERLASSAWKGKTVRLRVKTDDGAAVHTLPTAA